MTSNMTESGTHLTVSRVNRLLRPLRNKCNSLAALPKTATTSRVTYSRQSSNWDPDIHPPLGVLCPLAGAKRLTAGRHSAEDFELARRIHAVCDAFKNIAYVAFGQPCSDPIPSLAAMCTFVVGEGMPTATSESISGEDSTDESDILDMDHIYEVVPPHHRRFLILSHALTMILCLCSHHHTLVTILLDHCLSFGLVHQSTRLLNIVLAQAFQASNSSYPPPVTHPAHADYLIDLHAKWATGNNLSRTSSSSNSLIFTTSAFCQVVLSTLSQSLSTSSYILWTSKVLNRLLHTLRSCDIDSYSLTVRTLSQTFWATLGSSPDATRDDAQLSMLRDKLSELLSNLFDLLFAQHDSQTSSLTLPRVYAVIDILSDCHTAQLHCLRMSTPGSPIDVQDMIITFTTYILVTFRSSITRRDRLLDILGASDPIPTTFSKLMVYFSRRQETHTFRDFMEAFLSELKMYSSLFLSEKFFYLDASLWACALHHFQTSVSSSQKASSILVARYKRQLIDAVEAAEHRCFGGKVDNNCVVFLPDHPGSAMRAQRGRPSGHWDWEDMVGAWIRKTPVHKKLKIDDNRLHRSSRYNRSRSRSRSPNTTSPLAVSTSISTSIPLSTSRRHSSTSSPSPSYDQLSEAESATDNGSEYQDETDKEHYPINFPEVVRRQCNSIKRRSSKFFSLLADAENNRIELHSEPRPEPEHLSSIIPEKYVIPLSSQESRHGPRNPKQQARHRQAMPPPAPSGNLLLSDDSLDLFAYATSSPPRC